MDMGIEFTSYLRYVAALIFVLALIWVASYVLKRGMGHRLGIKRASEARLKIIEVLPIDSRHRLVMVLWDDKEHLMMIGHDHSIVIAEQAGAERKNVVSENSATIQSLKGRNKKEPVL